MAFICLQHDVFEIFVFGQLFNSINFQKYLGHFTEMTGVEGTSDMMSN